MMPVKRLSLVRFTGDFAIRAALAPHRACNRRKLALFFDRADLEFVKEGHQIATHAGKRVS
jgi:hypothetical protein